MTREMKIGLLLSLGIVIVVFVLLSDQVARTDVRPAEVTGAGPQANESLTTPGGASPTMAGPVKIDDSVAPGQQVATGQEIAPKPGTVQVNVGPGQLAAAANNNVPTGTKVLISPAPADPATPAGFEPVPSSPVQPLPAAADAPKTNEYKAVAGDTVAKLARKFYGSDTKANCDLIINANKSLKADPAKIAVGKVYLIPVKIAPVAAAAPAAPTTRPVAEALPAPSAARVYVVKSGDNLWKIAKEQCKDPNAVDQIKSLNRDQLKGRADLQVGMKLTLPPAKS